MQYSMKNKRNLDKWVSFNRQSGVSSLLFIVLVGLSLTVLTVGYMSTMRNLQSSATTTHAQTQAQMQAMIGYHALTKYLKKESLTNISKIETGVVSGGSENINFTKVACGGADQYCFDLVGKSGGATAIIRTNYKISERVDKINAKGSVFAGGLKVDGAASLSGDGVSILVKDSKVVNNQNVDISASLQGITVGKYEPSNFVDATSMKDYANYTFSKNGCEKLNLYDGVSKAKIDKGNLACNAFAGITQDNQGVWTIDTSKYVPVGVLWFKEKVIVKLTNKPFVNTVISETAIDSNIPNGNTHTSYYAYAPQAYQQVKQEAADIKLICGASGENIPSQYCKSDGTLKSSDDLKLFPANISNILFLTNGLVQLDSGNLGALNAVNFYGNIIASSGAGGAGMASAKFVGTGSINIEGNIIVTGETSMTEMLGSIKIKLLGADDAGSSLPGYIKELSVGGIRYM